MLHGWTKQFDCFYDTISERKKKNRTMWFCLDLWSEFPLREWERWSPCNGSICSCRMNRMPRNDGPIQQADNGNTRSLSLSLPLSLSLSLSLSLIFSLVAFCWLWNGRRRCMRPQWWCLAYTIPALPCSMGDLYKCLVFIVAGLGSWEKRD